MDANSMSIEELPAGMILATVYEDIERTRWRLIMIDTGSEDIQGNWISMIANHLWLALREVDGATWVVQIEDNQGIDPPEVKTHTLIDYRPATVMTGPNDIMSVIDAFVTQYGGENWNLKGIDR